MFEAARVSDKSAAPADAHGCSSCPHSVSGPGTSGAPDVFVNGLPALRVGDKGTHSSCCGSNRWTVAKGARAVFLNGKAAARKGDHVSHCGGRGALVGGSPDVFIGDDVQRGHASSKMATVAALLTAGAKFAFTLPQGLTPALGSALGEAFPFLLFKGLPSQIFKWLGKTVPLWADVLFTSLSAAAWIAMHTIKIDGRTLMGYAQWWFTNVLDNLLDPSDRVPWDECPVPGESSPPAFILFSSKKEDTELGPLNTDVTIRFPGLLRYFQPIEYQYDDDLYPISLPQLLKHSTLVADGNPAPLAVDGDDATILHDYAQILEHAVSGHIDVDDEYARRGGSDGSSPTVYGRVVHASPPDTTDTNVLRLDYVHVRAGSYMPTKELYDLSFQHEGDGETASIYLRFDGQSCTILSTETGGHEYKVTCQQALYEAAPPDSGDDAGEQVRPVIFIAHGSHAIATTPGKREARHGKNHVWTGSTDWHPPRKQGGGVVAFLPALISSSDPCVYCAVFTDKFQWGADEGSPKGQAVLSALAALGDCK